MWIYRSRRGGVDPRAKLSSVRTRPLNMQYNIIVIYMALVRSME